VIIRTEPASQSTSRIMIATWGLFLSLLLLMLGNGLLASLLGLRSGLAGFSTNVTGVVMSGYYLGFLLGAFIAPKFVERVGHVRVYAALASTASVSALVHLAFINPTLWFAMRFVTGFALAGLYIVAESWLASEATPSTRGRILGAYMVVMMGGYALSQALLTVSDVTGFTLFVLASILVSFAVVPVSLSASPTPDFSAPTKLPTRAIWDSAPLGVVTGIASGLAAAAFLGMGTVYASSVGMSVDRVALFVGLGVSGSVVLQWPIGAISDRFPRRRVLLTLTTVASLVAFAGSAVDPAGALLLAVVFLYGALAFPLYSVGLNHINDYIPPGAAMSASVVFVFVNGLGAVAGAPIAATAMTELGPHGYFWVLGVIHGAVGIYAAVRIVVREGIPVKAQRSFTMLPARTGSALALLGRRRRPPNGDTKPRS